MANLIEKIQEFGNLSFDAGVYEREDCFTDKSQLASDCFKQILHAIGQPDTKPVNTNKNMKGKKQ